MIPNEASRLAPLPKNNANDEDAPKNNGPNGKVIQKRMQTVLRPLTEYEGNYVDIEMLQKYNITCTDMDFYNGLAGKTSPYINLLSPQKIEQALQITKPWKLYEDWELEHQKEKDDSGCESPRSTASWIWCLVEEYLERDFDGLHNGIMPTLTNWVQVNLPKTPNLSRIAYLKYDWKLEGIFRPCLDYEPSIRDPEKPHLSGFVSDRATHREDALLTSELVSALYMAVTTALTKTYAPHQLIPVTTVSCSGRRMRVIQCIFNSRNGDIEIRKSPIVDFTDGILANSNETKFFTALSWIIGQPTGDTEGEGTN